MYNFVFWVNGFKWGFGFNSLYVNIINVKLVEKKNISLIFKII